MAQENPCRRVTALFSLGISGEVWAVLTAGVLLPARIWPRFSLGRHLRACSEDKTWEILGFSLIFELLGPVLVSNSVTFCKGHYEEATGRPFGLSH